jgi:FG-GAP repeat
MMAVMRSALVILLTGTCAALVGAQSGYKLAAIGDPANHNGDLGTQIAVVGDVDSDGVADWLVWDPRARMEYVTLIGEIRLVSGATGTTIRSHSGTVPGTQSEHVLAAAGDLDSDGIPDYAIGTPDVPLGGRIEVRSGATGAILWAMTGSVYTPISPFPIPAPDRLGASICAPGDITGDGVPDLAIGAPGASSASGTDHGLVVVRSGATGLVSSLPGTPSLALGMGLCGPGDLDGNGIADLIVGLGGQWGGVRAYAGGTAATLWTVPGATGLPIGKVLAAASDVNGDGVKDVVVGAPNALVPGLGSSAGKALVLSGVTGAQPFSMSGTSIGELLGKSVAGAGDLNGDGLGDVLVGSPTSLMTNSGPGKVQVAYGPAGTVVQPFITGSTPAAFLGTGLAGGVFVNADGIPDVLVGVPDAFGPGRVLALDGGTMATIYEVVGVPAPFSHYRFTSAADAGDQDGDGIADLALGQANGKVAIISGATAQPIRFLVGPPPFIYPQVLEVACVGFVDGDALQDLVVATVIQVPPSTVATTVRMDAISGATGMVLHSTVWTGCEPRIRLLAPADFNGDGVRDVVVGLPSACTLGMVPGSVEIRSGATGGLIQQTTGLAADGLAGSIDAVGDVDGDSVVDLVVGAPAANTGTVVAAGAVRILSGATLFTLFSVWGTTASQGLGASVAGIGDVDGDGIPDFAAADTQAGPTSSVPVRMFSGAGGAPLGTLSAGPSVPGFGYRVRGAGDVNGDGVPDVAVGAPTAPGSNPAIPSTGEAYVFSGTGGPPLFVVRGTQPAELFGTVLARAGDWNRDGLDDLLVASSGDPFNTMVAHADVVSFAGVPAGSQVIGSPCTLASGRKPSLAAFGGDPTSATGNPFFGFIVSNGSAGAVGAIAAGFSTSSWAGAALPLSLAPALPGCTLYVSVDNLVPFTLGTGLGGLGALTLPIAVPAAPGLAGTTAHLQAYVADSGTAPLPGAVTRALTVVVQ